MAEGGLRVPFIVSGPGVKRKGAVSHEILTVRDVAPTLLDVAGIRYPFVHYKGRKILPQSGRSFKKNLANKNTAVHSDTEAFAWELFKRRAVRKGDWKATWFERPFGLDQWQLYNLSSDPGEANDLAGLEPAKLAEMVAEWEAYVIENNVIISDSPLVFP
jgi:arylsulfatase